VLPENETPPFEGILYGVIMAAIFTPLFMVVSIKVKYDDKAQFSRTLFSRFHEIGYHITKELRSSIQLEYRLSFKLFNLNIFSLQTANVIKRAGDFATRPRPLKGFLCVRWFTLAGRPNMLSTRG
jgi:hypothetical protein